MTRTTSHDVKWWESAKIYELYVDKFADNFKGLTSRLDYFEHLGINTLHVLPHYPSPMVDDGYDVSDYRSVRPELGTVEDFKTFSDEAHRRGIRIIVDFVLNHVSSQHPWFLEASSSEANQKRDFFLWSKTGAELPDCANPFIDFKPQNWIWNEATADYFYATFYPAQPDLNWENPEVFSLMVDNMNFWVDLGVNGFRLDAIPYLIKRENSSSRGLPETHDIIKRIRAHLDRAYDGRIALLAEASGNIEESASYFGNGDECQLVYSFALAIRMFEAVYENNTRPIVELTELPIFRNIPEHCSWGVFLRNHDDINMDGVPDGERAGLLNFLDPKHEYPFLNGKTASVRLGTIFFDSPERILESFRLLYSMPGVPVMYYGDEIGMRNLPVADNIVDTRIYVRGDFDWRIADAMLKDPTSLLENTARCIKGGRTNADNKSSA